MLANNHACGYLMYCYENIYPADRLEMRCVGLSLMGATLENLIIKNDPSHCAQLTWLHLYGPLNGGVSFQTAHHTRLAMNEMPSELLNEILILALTSNPQ